MSAPVCIWCLKPSADSDIEHIFPEALGCPPELTLPGYAVCRKCNNDLGHLDLAVIEDFDFSRLLHEIPRKKKRPPEITGRGNVYGYLGQSGPEIYFNAESSALTLKNGREVSAYRNNARDVKPSIKKTVKLWK